MRLQSPWMPRLAEMDGPPSERLVAALADDILEGRLENGARLPAHRDLAWKLGLGIGTVTKAYAILERRGLTRSVLGRGTFVASAADDREPRIDLSVNTPPAMLSERLLAKTFAALSRRVDPTLFSAYPPARGHAEHRRLMARWLADLGVDADAENLLLTNGAQQALAVAFAVLCQPGATILTETFNYPGVIKLATQAGYHLRALAMDEDGLRPAALEMALTSFSAARPTALYVTPRMHNPTTATMSSQRRREIVALCRRHDLFIIEDDVYALEGDATADTLWSLAPERVFYISSLSKTLSPALRIGALVAPPAFMSQAESALSATSLMVAPLSYAIMQQWLADGTAASVRGSIRLEAQRRQSLAASILSGQMVQPSQGGFHGWLPMTYGEAQRLHAAAALAGIAVTPPQAVMVNADDADTDSRSGIRLCLGAPNLADLADALRLIAKIRAEMSGDVSAGGPPV